MAAWLNGGRRSPGVEEVGQDGGDSAAHASLFGKTNRGKVELRFRRWAEECVASAVPKPA